MTGVADVSGLELRSKITSGGELDLWLEDVAVPEPAADELVVRVEAAPLNPSDILLLLGPVDLSTIQSGGTNDRPTVTATIPRSRMAGVAGRLDLPLPVGNEGAGIAIKAGADVQALIGRTVAARSNRGMYAQYRVVKASDCLLLPQGTTARDGASAFINPLTVLGMVETMHREGHIALVHTAAASNLGQMLNRVCLADGIGLVNIVRSPRQAEILRRTGAKYVLDSTAPTFGRDLADALAETGATLAFDAIGGGAMAATILSSMEQVASRNATDYSRYGSSIQKQVYMYGLLDPGPKVIEGNLGMAWSVGGWLMTWFYQKIEPDTAQRLRDRVAAELTTTFASRYTSAISLAEVLSPDVIAAYSKRATGEKYLVVPNGRLRAET
jgi:NADPH:quinone reductase-like Zn-dependent oxidoreductase